MSIINIASISNTDHYLLTFNGITKLVLDEILLDTNNKVIESQWHLFQLQKISEILNINYKDSITGGFYNNILLYHKIIKIPDYNTKYKNTFIFNNNENITKKKYGLIPELSETSDEYINLIGGSPFQPLELNSQKNLVLFDIKLNFYRYYNEILLDKLIIDTPIELITETSIDSTIDTSIESNIGPSTETSTEPSTEPSKEPTIESSIKTTSQAYCEYTPNYLHNYENKCYMDVLFQNLLLSTPNNNYLYSTLIDFLNKYKITTQYENNRNFANNIIELSNKLKEPIQEKILTMDDVVKSIGKLTEDFKGNQITDLALEDVKLFTSNTPNDVNYLLSWFLQFINIPINNYSESIIYYINLPEDLNHSHINYGENIKDLSTYPISNTSPTKEIKTNSPLITLLNPPIPINNTSISNQPLEIKDLLNRQEISTLYKTSKGEKQPFIKGINGWEYNSKTAQFTYNDEFIDYKNTSIVDNNIISQDKIIGNLYNCTLSNYNLSDTSDCLFIPITRSSIINIYDTQTLVDNINLMEIIPNQKIEINNKILNLTCIINYKSLTPTYGHYISYFICKDNWYIYDDLTGIQLIGNYNDLLKINDGLVKKTSVLLIYQI